MHHQRYKKYRAMSLRTLKQLRDDIQMIIDEIESDPIPRNVDIGENFSGETGLIAEVLQKNDCKKEFKWHQIQTIYCSPKRCRRCPHGPFLYLYLRKKKTGEVTVKYIGEPVFDPRLIAKAFKSAKAPKFIGTLHS
jgi:hypothetical protein